MKRNQILVIGELDKRGYNMIKEWIKYFLTWLVFTAGLVITVISIMLSVYYLVEENMFNLIISALFIPFGTALAVTSWKYKEDQYD